MHLQARSTKLPDRTLDVLSSAAAGCGPGVVVDLERLWRRALLCRDVNQVDPDSIPCRAAAAHRVDEDIGGFEVGDHLWVARLPVFEPLPRLLLRPGAGDLDHGHGGPATAGRARLLAGSRGRDGTRAAAGT